ncbi:flagellar basal-body MS-ring/collar protein FliF [Helicobacter mustelae]|uniref:Flagellar M-ring protein n=1 Tax=Helicobacter mustelae (strain ATCC 43772 / CCUG 25715 / CIP 103759 / LMG 18044 / NCTC 12198 / R85-136P) TaxID=679897 RepID=D3UIW7_HELM1|nr:flagellar basal-body MS-ring/collar protein FliF [Helicobacter mustelae]CBG40442.1 flagellar M-ring protein [Helicobacter mustelae 12198]SQH71942.1 flagellar M-ring protein [Helicobacter mustelae]
MDLRAVFSQILNFFQRFSKKQRVIVIGGVIAAIAFFVFLIVFATNGKSRSDGYSVLFEGLTPGDNALIIQHLQQNQIPYKIPNEETILIPRDKVYEQRIELASQGIPKNSKVGFEIFDTKDFGMTDEEHRVKFLRAIEGELSRTIESLAPIQKANVLIAMPKSSVFVSQQTPPTASVMLGIRQGAALTSAQIFGIKNLVAAAIPNLTVENVKLVSQNGEPLGEDDEITSSKEVAAAQLKYKQNIERALEAKILNILSPVVGGEDKVVAKVNADFDFSQRKSLQEIYDPNNVVRSEQNLEEKREGAQEKQIGGVPGAVSNIGPVQGLDSQNGREKYEKTQNTTNYEVGKTVNEIKGEFGVLTRLSAAVVVDGRYKRVLNKEDGLEHMEFVPLSEAEMEKINLLVKQAIGYNQKRGDDVTVSNFEFNAKSQTFVPEGKMDRFASKLEMYLKPFTPLLKYLIVALIIFIFYRKIIVPFAERMLETQNNEEEKVESLFEATDDEDEDVNKFSEMRKRVEEQLGIGKNFNEEEVRYDVLLEKTKNIIEKKPEEIAMLFKTLIKDEINPDMK